MIPENKDNYRFRYVSNSTYSIQCRHIYGAEQTPEFPSGKTVEIEGSKNETVSVPGEIVWNEQELYNTALRDGFTNEEETEAEFIARADEWKDVLVLDPADDKPDTLHSKYFGKPKPKKRAAKPKKK